MGTPATVWLQAAKPTDAFDCRKGVPNSTRLTEPRHLVVTSNMRQSQDGVNSLVYSVCSQVRSLARLLMAPSFTGTGGAWLRGRDLDLDLRCGYAVLKVNECTVCVRAPRVRR